ncbi:MAG: ribosome maturation factor RimP [Actinobacteria bacterium]|nr:ribosome maturation factor RimP [Actinomycetota bacterium]
MSALDEVRDLAEAVVRRRDLELWDVEFAGQAGNSVVRVFVHADDGVDLDTVAAVSEEISRGLDLKDPIPGRYTLEVSTPGLERNLRTPDHFERSVGDKVVVKTTEVLTGNSHRIEGTVVEASSDVVVLDANEEKVEVPYGLIKSARTVFEWR